MNFHKALVTGASSGLGFEAAAQLAEEGVSEVVITARSQAKGHDAARRLVDRTGREVFSVVVVDLGDLASIESAVESLAGGDPVDFLLLNAGIAPTPELQHTADGIELTVASSLTGHHLLTMRMLEAGLLAPDAAIVIAGSEAARGDVPTFKPADISALATEFGGDHKAAIESYMRMDPEIGYRPSNTYATAKLFVAWWAAELAARLPEGMTVNAVSPGSTPDTNAIRNAPSYMRYVMIPILKLLPGMSHTVAAGARRYLDVAAAGDATGKFFASRPKKMTGPLAEVTLPHFDNPEASAALWEVTAELTGAGYR